MPETSANKKKCEERVGTFKPTAVLLTYMRLQATPLEQLKQAELGSMTATLKAKATLNINKANHEIEACLTGAVLTIP